MSAFVTIRGKMYDLDFMVDSEGNEYRVCQCCHIVYKELKGFDSWFHSKECMEKYIKPSH